MESKYFFEWMELNLSSKIILNLMKLFSGLILLKPKRATVSLVIVPLGSNEIDVISFEMISLTAIVLPIIEKYTRYRLSVFIILISLAYNFKPLSGK